MCFVRSWKIGFFTIWMATLLSHNIWIGFFTETLIKPFNHTIYVVVEAMLLNSILLELLATVSCFFDFQDIKSYLNNTK